MIPYSSLTDGQVTLRPFQFTDVSDLYEAVSESLPELKPWMSWAQDRYTVMDSGDFVALVRAKWGDGSVYGFAITDAQDGTLLGDAASVTSIAFIDSATWDTGSERSSAAGGSQDEQPNWQLAGA
jgi:RimJ/RimL family protein N-acetyltransferase